MPAFPPPVRVIHQVFARGDAAVVVPGYDRLPATVFPPSNPQTPTFQTFFRTYGCVWI